MIRPASVLKRRRAAGLAAPPPPRKRGRGGAEPGARAAAAGAGGSRSAAADGDGGGGGGGDGGVRIHVGVGVSGGVGGGGGGGGDDGGCGGCGGGCGGISPPPRPARVPRRAKIQIQNILVKRAPAGTGAVVEVASAPLRVPAPPLPLSVSADQVRYYRMRRSGLLEPFVDAGAAAAALMGVQAQVNSAALTALWQRLRGGASAADDFGMDIPMGGNAPTLASLTTEAYGALARGAHRALVRLWGQRGTLHLYATSDWPMVSASVGPREAARVGDRHAASALAAAVGAVTGHLAEGQRVTREVFTTALRQPAALRYGAFICATLVGAGARSDTGDNGRVELAPRREWAPQHEAWAAPAACAATEALAARYFACYGPSCEADFRYWSGLRADQSRAAVASLVARGAFLPVRVASGHGRDGPPLLVLRDEAHVLAADVGEWPVRMLGRYDPLLLGHKDKGVWVDRAHYRRVWSKNATIEATLLIRGRIAGVWAAERVGEGGLSVTVRAFDAAAVRGAMPAIMKQAAGIARFWGRELTGVVVSGGDSGGEGGGGGGRGGEGGAVDA